MSDKGVSCYVNEVTYGSDLRMGLVATGANQVIEGLEQSVPPNPDLWGGQRTRGLNQSLMANHLIHQACVMKPP